MFPNDFVWGAASGAVQIEGSPFENGGGASVWDVFCAFDGHIQNGDNASAAADTYHRYEEDIELMAQLGIRAYRFSISWARVDPFGDGTWNMAGVAYYDRVIDCLIAHGITPFITLHHWELPQALQDKGGWLNLATVNEFARFAECCAVHFGDRCEHFFTLNTPQIFLQKGMKEGIHAPGMTLQGESLMTAWRNLLFANGLAVRKMRAAAPRIQIGIASAGRLCYPDREKPLDISAASHASSALTDEDWLFTHPMLLDPIILGRLDAPEGSELAEFWKTITDEQLAMIHEVPDFLGISCYNGSRIHWDAVHGGVFVPTESGAASASPKSPVTPEVMNYGIRWIHERYKLPIYISENGQSCNDRIFLDGKVHDPDRIDFLSRYLKELEKAVSKAEVKGYFHWSLTDGFEWDNGYSDRFGLIFVDYPTQRRILKDSAFWYSDIVKSNGEVLGS